MKYVLDPVGMAGKKVTEPLNKTIRGKTQKRRTNTWRTGRMKQSAQSEEQH